jgi:hypothetical protein
LVDVTVSAARAANNRNVFKQVEQNETSARLAAGCASHPKLIAFAA